MRGVMCESGRKANRFTCLSAMAEGWKFCSMVKAEERRVAPVDALTDELLRLNRRLEAVLTNTADGMLLVAEDEGEGVILANVAVREAFGLDDAVTGQPLADVVNDEILLDVFQRARESSSSARAEIPLSDERTLNVHVTPIEGVGQVAVMQDISYLKE